jgi:hypothetical protein
MRDIVAKKESELETTLNEISKKIVKHSKTVSQIEKCASKAILKYGFMKFDKGQILANSSVISIRDFQDDPTNYLSRLKRGMFCTPVKINFNGINDILDEDDIGTIEYDGTFQFFSSRICRSDKRKRLFREVLKKVNIQRNRYGNEINELEPVDFLTNLNSITKFAKKGDLKKINIKKLVDSLTLTKFVYLTALEIEGTSRIRDLNELLRYESLEKHHLTGKLNSNSNIGAKAKFELKKLLLKESYTNQLELEKLLPIGSQKSFRDFSYQITDSLFQKGMGKFTSKDDPSKKLKDYSIGEYIALACLFARKIINKYKTKNDEIEDLWEETFEIGGKCTDFAALTIHYIEESLRSKYEDKFINWRFEIETEIIGEKYKHAYVKASHINQDLTVDVWYFDPTKLSSKGINELKSPEDIFDQIDASQLPLELDRNASDLLYTSMQVSRLRLDQY